MRQASKVGTWAAALATLTAGAAHAAGFEKSTPLSGRYAGMGGATAAIVEGAQSLVFNPAGLAASGAGPREGAGPLELSLQLSPTWSQFKGPISSARQLTSETGFSPIAGGFVSWRPFDRLGLGAGLSVIGGNNVDYKNVDFSGMNPSFDTLHPEFKAYVRIIDATIGGGLELAEGLRVGAAWRVSFVAAEVDSATPVPAPAGSPPGTPPVALVAARLTDLTDTKFNGFRVGFQYAPKSGCFSLGAAWRSPVSFTAQGTAAGAIESGTGPNTPSAALPGSTATVSSQFPSQITAGLSLSFAPEVFRVVGEYMFTNYSIDPRLRIAGSLQSPSGPIALRDLELGWNNQHNVRAGLEFLGIPKVALRAGYVWTSQVTPNAKARATLASPAAANTITLGAGTNAVERLRLDAAFEYSWAAGDGTGEFGIPGSFEERAFAAHLGATVVF